MKTRLFLGKVLEVSSVDLGYSSIQPGLIHPSAFMVGPQGDDYLPVQEGQTEGEKRERERKKGEKGLVLSRLLWHKTLFHQTNLQPFFFSVCC